MHNVHNAMKARLIQALLIAAVTTLRRLKHRLVRRSSTTIEQERVWKGKQKRKVKVRRG